MKIIGKSGEREFIVTIREDEIAKIAGFDYASEMKPYPVPGQEIPVSALWTALSVSRHRKTEIAGLAESLRKVAGRVDSINQALAAPIIEVKTS